MPRTQIGAPCFDWNLGLFWRVDRLRLTALSFVFRIDGTQFAGATQLLPIGASPEQAEAAFSSLMKSLGGRIPETGHVNLKLARARISFVLSATAYNNLCLPDGPWLIASPPILWHPRV